MKVIEVKQQAGVLPATPQRIIEAIHACAKANGSKFEIHLKTAEQFGNLLIYSETTCSNSDYTKGYFAVLYIVDSMYKAGGPSAFTNPGSKGWFGIVVPDCCAEDFIKGLTN